MADSGVGPGPPCEERGAGWLDAAFSSVGDAHGAWATYEGAACTLLPNPEFLAPDLECARHLPAFVVHGRYDLVCPIVGADDLHRAWPEASYVIVDDAGHSSHEPGIARQLVAAMDRVARTGSPRL